MSESFFYTNNQRQPTGPVSLDELRELAEQKQITAATLIARPGDAAWRTWAMFSADFPPAVQTHKPAWVPPAQPTQTSKPAWAPPPPPDIAKARVPASQPLKVGVAAAQPQAPVPTSRPSYADSFEGNRPTVQLDKPDTPPTPVAHLASDKPCALAVVPKPAHVRPIAELSHSSATLSIEPTPHPGGNAPEPMQVDLEAPRPELSPEAQALIKAVDSPVNWFVVCAVAVVFFGILAVAAWCASCQGGR